VTDDFTHVATTHVAKMEMANATRYALVTVATNPRGLTMSTAARRISFLIAGFAASFASAFASDTSEIQLGEIPHFNDEASALAGCAPDRVVWADRKNGFYYPKFYSDYGKTAHGVFTCFKKAKDADYWSLTPASDGGHKGREFPQFFCYACS
jgi:hypothetical protein